MPASNNVFQRNANTSLVAQLIWKQGGLSRVDISRTLQLNKSTVSNIISYLMDIGLVNEGEQERHDDDHHRAIYNNVGILVCIHNSSFLMNPLSVYSLCSLPDIGIHHIVVDERSHHIAEEDGEHHALGEARVHHTDDDGKRADEQAVDILSGVGAA